MNCPLATSRFFMGTLHQVHRRSGISEEGASERAVIAQTFSTSVKNLVNRPSCKNFLIAVTQMKKIVV